MTKETLQQWHECNAQGLIPGPDETEAAYDKRVAFCQDLKQQLIQKVGADLPFEVKDAADQHLLEEVFPHTQELYGIRPQWVPLFFSNYQLSPWHGGCAWIFQLNEQTPTAAFLQLRAHFRSSPTYLGIYRRQELIAHELAHVGRMLYQEPQFEEILAYQSSASRWRRWLGPIVQSSKESLMFIFVLGLVVMTDLALLSIQTPSAMLIATWVKLIPFILVSLALGRLWHRHYLFKRCLQKLKKIFPPPIANHLLYRLRDREIKEFAHFSPVQIQNFMEKEAQNSFRWRFLKAVYNRTRMEIMG